MQAFHALLFLYQRVLEIDVGRLDAVRAHRPEHLPVVLSPEEVRQLLDRIQGCGGCEAAQRWCGLRRKRFHSSARLTVTAI
jgi:hypothetical protein